MLSALGDVSGPHAPCGCNGGYEPAYPSVQNPKVGDSDILQ
jgi:hypothetical protein